MEIFLPQRLRHQRVLSYSNWRPEDEFTDSAGRILLRTATGKAEAGIIAPQTRRQSSPEAKRIQRRSLELLPASTWQSGFAQPGKVLSACTKSVPRYNVAPLRKGGGGLKRAVRRTYTLTSFHGGREMHGDIEASADKSLQSPRAAATLILDVSGFSALCAKYTKEGTAGCEGFSLIVSEYLARLVDVVESFGGDVEAFAGDALICIFFATAPSTPVATSEGPPGLQCAILKAICCAKQALEDHGQFLPFPNSPIKLHLHAAVAAGMLWSLESEGSISMRAEAFLVGQPILELGNALKQSKSLQLVAAKSAWELVKDSLRGSDLEHGCARVDLSSCRQTRGSLDELPTRPATELTHNKLKASLFWSSANTSNSSGSNSTGSIMLNRTREMSILETDQWARRYLPSLVADKVASGMIDRLAEHRYVSIVFLVQQEVDGAELAQTDSLERLQHSLGTVIDVVEVRWGGSTRQITFDDKGLTAIFVFGLSGSDIEDHPSRCIMASMEALCTLQKLGVGTWTAGISTGFCFCGPVGNTSKRCEYVIMGDAVVTAARMAGKAKTLGKSILCSEATYKAFDQMGSSHSQIALHHAGAALLKGSTVETQLYCPEISSISEDTRRAGMVWDERQCCYTQKRSSTTGATTSLRVMENAGAVKGLEVLTRSIRQVILKTIKQMFDSGSQKRVIILEGPSGMGKEVILNMVQRFVAAGSLRVTPHAKVIHLSCTSVSSPFQTCSDLVNELADITGHLLHIPCFLYEVNPNLLPARLRVEMAKDLAAMSEMEGTAKSLFARGLYLRTILALMVEAGRPLVVIIDHINWMDDESWTVLSSPEFCRPPSHYASPSSISKPGADKAMHLLPLTFLFSCRPRIDQSERFAEQYEVLCNHTCTKYIQLQPLSDQDIIELAKDAMHAVELSEELGALITGYSHGIPLNAIGIARWLNEQGMVVEDSSGVHHLSSTKRRDEEFLPPMIHSMTQATLDHLPQLLSTVLKCGSVMGMHFTTDDVMMLFPIMMPAVFHVDRQEIQKALMTLERIKIISCSTMRHSALTGERERREQAQLKTVWEFNSKIHREVAYGTLLHKHRQKLHLAVARHLELHAKASAPGDLLKQPQIEHQLKIVHHWMFGVNENTTSRMSLSSRLQSNKVHQADLKLAANATEELLYMCHRRGMHVLNDTEDILNSLLGIATRVDSTEGGWILEMRTLRYFTAYLMAMANSPRSTDEEVKDLLRRCQNMIARADDMNDKCFLINKVMHRRSSLSSDGILGDHNIQVRRSLDGHAPTSLIKSVHDLADSLRDADSTYSEIWARRSSSSKILPFSNHDIFKLDLGLRRLSSNHAKVEHHTGSRKCYVKHYCSLARFLRGDLEEAGMLAKSAYIQWTNSGCLDMYNILGAPVGELALALWHLSDGVSSGHFRLRAKSDMQDAGFLQFDNIGGHVWNVLTAFGEALWEPATSGRVQSVLEGSSREIVSKSKCLGQKHGGVIPESLAEGLQKLSLLAKASEDPGSEQSWVSDTEQFVSRVAHRRCLQAYLIPVATRLLARRAWAASVAKFAASTTNPWHSAPQKPAEDLAPLSKALSFCVQTWETVLAVPDNCETSFFLGASLAYCKAVSKLLICTPWSSIDRKEGIKDMIHAWSLSIGMESNGVSPRCREPLTAGFPAAVAICQLLSMEKGKQSSPRKLIKFPRSIHRSRRMVEVPANLADIFSDEKCPGNPVLLEFGSDIARAWATFKLEALLDAATHTLSSESENSLTPSAVRNWRCAQEPSVVGRSITLWDAIQLWHRLSTPVNSKKYKANSPSISPSSRKTRRCSQSVMLPISPDLDTRTSLDSSPQSAGRRLRRTIFNVSDN